MHAGADQGAQITHCTQRQCTLHTHTHQSRQRKTLSPLQCAQVGWYMQAQIKGVWIDQYFFTLGRCEVHTACNQGVQSSHCVCLAGDTAAQRPAAGCICARTSAACTTVFHTPRLPCAVYTLTLRAAAKLKPTTIAQLYCNNCTIVLQVLLLMRSTRHAACTPRQRTR